MAPNRPSVAEKASSREWVRMRLGETYLLRAEARFRQGNTQGAADDINVLRDRAFKDYRAVAPGAGKVTADQIDIDFILDERARELYGEEHRAVTLSRLSTKENPILVQRTRKYGYRFPAATNELKDAGPNIQDYQWQYPIPLQVIEANSGANFPQNEGY